MPQVSIVIPVHNGEKTLSRALSSIADQTFRDFETVLVNNNCSDGSLEIAEEYSERINLRIVSCATPGIVPALNTGIYNSDSQFIARQDDDDYWYPQKLEKQINFMNQFPETSILGTQMRLLDEDGNVQEVGTYGRPVNYPEDDQHIRLMMLLGQNPLCHPSVVMKREVPLLVGGYSQFFHLAEDLHLWLRAFPFARFANLPEVLIDYTQTIREDYDPRVTQVLSKTYYELYKTAGIVVGDRPAIKYDWENE